MYDKYDSVQAIILTYITCGFYGIYLYYKIARDVNNMAEKEGKEKVMGYIPAVLLACVTFGIYGIYWMYKFCCLQHDIAQSRGAVLTPDTPILTFICMFIPSLQIYVICENFGKLTDSYNGR